MNHEINVSAHYENQSVIYHLSFPSSTTMAEFQIETALAVWVWRENDLEQNHVGM